MSWPAEDPPARWLPDSPSSPIAAVAARMPGMATAWLVEFRVGPQSLPYLAEHGFHDMMIVPGSFYIQLARQIHRDLFHRDAVSLRHIEFARPVILTGADIAITVRVEQHDGGPIAYELFEGTTDDLRQAPAPQPCARLEVDVELAQGPADAAALRFDADEFLQRSGPLGPGEEFYQALRRNGNQYGPSFQTLAALSLAGSQVAGRFADVAQHSAGRLSPPLLDAAAQLLSALTLDCGRTFILKSIDRLLVASSGGPAPCWAHASRTDSAGSDPAALAGSVLVVDANGTRLWELSGMTLAFIDRPAPGESTALTATRLCVASTFTAEPLEESLRFWGEYFGRNVRVDFAPYNQVFQQLLDPLSPFHKNRDGLNLIVLGLEDWLHEERPALQPADPARLAACFGSKPRCVLPNGLEIVHLNRYETDYVWQEIFGDLSYLRHDIRLADGDTVVDIGANIGLFSLFVLSRCRNPAIYAYEPSPRVFDLLQANCAAYGDPARIHPFNCGVAEKMGRDRFTFYENSSVFSGFHPDEHEDRAAVQAVVRNVLQNELSDAGGVRDRDVQDLTTNRLRAETLECPLTSVSDIIRDNGLERIHLLKIDAEKSELGIIRGIADEHWPLIDQIVMEIHDRTRTTVLAMETLLLQRGFRCAVIEEKLLEDSGLFNIYATRRAPAAAVGPADDGLSRKVGEFCAAFDTFAESSPAPLILAIAPRSPSVGDATRLAALNAAEDQVIARAARHPQIRSISSPSMLARYPVRDLHDAHSRQLGHVPFTQDGYAAIGTALARAVFNVSAPPVKVIVLDCDNTLWQGLCAEDGPAGVAVTPPFRHLQEFMIGQMQAGVLLALCSKNQEADVLAVFAERADMPLGREHLAGWRINWEPKPDNLRALAAQLNLGLESFVFIDDNPVECAAVRAGCPEVLVLQLPQASERIPAFLDSLWIFDRATATREDRARSHWYQADSERAELRSAAPTLRAFLGGLQLRIEVTEATDDQLARVAQLTLRTNQFNLTSIRRSEGEIRDLLKSGAKCLVTSVSDRFGDYGLVGVTLCTADAARCRVDTLLLSCRALGKGIEHRMLAELAGRALRDGKSIIEVPYRRTDRNAPAREFVARLGSAPTGSDCTLELPAAALAALRYEPEDQTAGARSKESGAPESSTASRGGSFGRANLSAAMQGLGDRLATVEAIVAALESSRLRAQPAGVPDGPEMMEDASALERSLAAIWKKALGRTRVGFNENFFDAGGTSLKAVVVVAMIRKELKRNASVISLFECPTIRLLAARLDGSQSPADGGAAAAASAESRGRQRRGKLIQRRAV